MICLIILSGWNYIVLNDKMINKLEGTCGVIYSSILSFSWKGWEITDYLIQGS
jgi:hypothetical protein